MWSTRIGQITKVAPEQSNYYIDKIKKWEEDEFIPKLFEEPHIGGAFNNWVWAPMRNVVKFCIEGDPKPPNFIQMMIQTKELRP